MTPISDVVAETYSSFQIDCKDTTKAHYYKLWHIDQVYSHDLAEELKAMDIETLDQQFSNHQITLKTDTSTGLTPRQSGTKGWYFARELDSTYQHFLSTTQPFFVEINDKESHNTVIVPKSNGNVGNIEVNISACQIDGVSIDDFTSKFQLFYPENDQALSFVDGDFVPEYLGEHSTILSTDRLGHAMLSGIPEGEYILKSVQSMNSYKWKENQYLIRVKPDQTIQISICLLKPIKEEVTGGKQFRKVDHDNPSLGLPLAKFKVVQWQKNQFQDVKVNDKVVTLASDKDGYFQIEHLPYGQYYLIETKAPIYNGIAYQVIEQAIPFEINKDSFREDQALAITNKPMKQEETTSIPATSTEKGDSDVESSFVTEESSVVEVETSNYPVKVDPQAPNNQHPLPMTGENQVRYIWISGVLCLSGFILLSKRKLD